MIENIIFFITDMTKSIDNVTAMKKRLKTLAKQQSCEQRELEVRGQRLSASECRRYSMLDSNRPPSKSHDHSFPHSSHSYSSREFVSKFLLCALCSSDVVSFDHIYELSRSATHQMGYTLEIY